MQDPTQGVPPQLLPHVHLISQNKYPLFHQLQMEQAYQFLFEAPKVVKQIAPMQWQYLAGPQDGTVFLTWVGGRMANMFASDGYVWADQEQRYTQDFGGYTLEIAVHQSGYRPGIDQLSSHMRRRYRFVSKNPAVTALPPDPSLWIVHYSPAEPQYCIPVNQVMVSPQIRNQLTERQWIETQGRLEQQAFMLHDREKWPHLNLPGRSGLPGPVYNPGMHGQNPMAHIGNPRFSGQFYQQAAQQAQAGPSPAKRQRQNPPSQMPASAAALMATDTSIEDEENVLYGDILDHLTQRDISLTRYMQHHEWMEEVFSSPYATGSIVPADLGFGLMGELAGLTKGILDVSTGEEEKAVAKTAPEPSFRKVSPEQLQEFEKRVKAHMEKGQADLEKMKEEHAKKMAGLKKSKMLIQAEKRLRNAVWDPADTGNEFWRLERASVTNGDASASHTKESAENIVKEVENALGGSVQSQKEATLLERGGLRERVAAPPPPPPAPEATSDDLTNEIQMGMDGSFEGSAQTQQGQLGQQATTGSEQIQPTASTTEAAQNPQQQLQQQAQAQAQAQIQQQAHAQQQQQQQPNVQVPAQQQQQPEQSVNLSAPHDAHMGDSEVMLDDADNLDFTADLQMDDMDVDESALDFGTDSPAPKQTNTISTPSTTWNQQPQQQQQQQQQVPQQLNAAPVSAPQPQSIDNAAPQAAVEQDMFNTSTSTPAGGDNAFTDFDTGDGLIDFDGGEADLGFDMDNSAFGDAFHGTEAHDEGA